MGVLPQGPNKEEMEKALPGFAPLQPQDSRSAVKTIPQVRRATIQCSTSEADRHCCRCRAQDEPRVRSRAARAEVHGIRAVRGKQCTHVFNGHSQQPCHRLSNTTRSCWCHTRLTTRLSGRPPCAPYRNGNAAEAASAKEKEIRNGAGGSSAARQLKLLQLQLQQQRRQRRRAVEGSDRARPCGSPQAPTGLGRTQLHFVLNVLIQTPSR